MENNKTLSPKSVFRELNREMYAKLLQICILAISIYISIGTSDNDKPSNGKADIQNNGSVDAFDDAALDHRDADANNDEVQHNLEGAKPNGAEPDIENADANDNPGTGEDILGEHDDAGQENGNEDEHDEYDMNREESELDYESESYDGHEEEIVENMPGSSEMLDRNTPELGFDLSYDEMMKLKMWPDAFIPYYIDVYSFNDKVMRDKIRSFLSSVNSLTALNFVELPSPPSNNIRWVFFVNRRGLLGCADHSIRNFTNAGVQQVVLGYHCMSTGGELAEAVLAIAGVPAQHNAPDRDYYIKIKEENIIPGKSSWRGVTILKYGGTIKEMVEDKPEKIQKYTGFKVLELLRGKYRCAFRTFYRTAKSKPCLMSNEEKKYLFEKRMDDEWLFHDLEYDFNSAGHFHSFKHSINGRATIETQKKTKTVTIGESKVLTASDILKIRMLYNFIVKKKLLQARDCHKLFEPGKKFSQYKPSDQHKARPKPFRYTGESADALSDKDDDEVDSQQPIDNEDDNNKNDDFNVETPNDINPDGKSYAPNENQMANNGSDEEVSNEEYVDDYASGVNEYEPPSYNYEYNSGDSKNGNSLNQNEEEESDNLSPWEFINGKKPTIVKIAGGGQTVPLLNEPHQIIHLAGYENQPLPTASAKLPKPRNKITPDLLSALSDFNTDEEGQATKKTGSQNLKQLYTLHSKKGT